MLWVLINVVSLFKLLYVFVFVCNSAAACLCQDTLEKKIFNLKDGWTRTPPPYHLISYDRFVLWNARQAALSSQAGTVSWPQSHGEPQAVRQINGGDQGGSNIELRDRARGWTLLSAGGVFALLQHCPIKQ